MNNYKHPGRPRESLLRKVHILVLRISVSSKTISTIYWMLRSFFGKGGFGREAQAVLAGKLAYYESLVDPRINTSLLRRNIHRLEKGLLMKPRRVPFALGYIGETVNAYVRAVHAEVDAKEITWAHDVLAEYMRISPRDPKIDRLRKVFHEANSHGFNQRGDSPKNIPYLREVSNAPAFSYSDLLQLAKFRRSVRWYRPDPVPRAIVERALDVASLSPTACNRQPYQFRVFDDPSLVAELIKLPGGTSGFSHQVPAVVVVVGRLRNYPGGHDRHCIYTDASLAIMSFVYAMEVQGVGTCCINWPDHELKERAMASFLKLEPDERPVMLVSYGWPDPEGAVACSTKKSISNICKYNFEGS